MRLCFSLLGPLEIRRDGEAVRHMPARRSRVILALLLLEPEHRIDRARMVGELWGDVPPPSAPANLRAHISALRSWLASWPGCRLERWWNGWALVTADGVEIEVDVTMFESNLARARRAMKASLPEEAARCYRRAVETFRGQPFQGIGQGPVLEARAAALTTQWLACVEEYAGVLLSLGEHELVTLLLHGFVRQQPTRERAWAQLMLARYRGGDAAAALAVYRRARGVLAEALGLEPGPELVELHRAILRRDPHLTP